MCHCSIAPALKRLGAGFAYTLLYQVASYYFPDQYMMSDDFSVSGRGRGCGLLVVNGGGCGGVLDQHMVSEDFAVNMRGWVVAGACGEPSSLTKNNFRSWMETL